MMDLTARANDIQIILTRREFNLVTKALMGKLSPEPHPKCDDDDVPDAAALGELLMEKRLRCAQKEVELLGIAINKAKGGE
jgi:hypothetical protein|tara:strand:+ start:1120 stop:1362 length:243 start_codon:yes stop_codon:yes gene_type:complete